MTYATIEEAWGGISGSHMLNTPLNQQNSPRIRQLKQQQEKEKQQELQMKQKQQQAQEDYGNRYTCMYGNSETCNNVVHRNNAFNQRQKQVATGMQQPYTGYPYLPQYPWYPTPKAAYLGYTPYISQQFYNNPYAYAPEIANEIHNAQVNPGIGQRPPYPVPIGQYQPDGYFPGYPQYNPQYFPENRRRRRKEHFTNNLQANSNMYIIFIIFMVFISALAIILCLSLIALHQQHKSK